MTHAHDNNIPGEMHNPPHPGLVIREMLLEPLKLTVEEAARRLDVDRKTFSRVVNGRSAITVKMALKLAKALGTSSKVWLGMQHAYDSWQLRDWVGLAPVQGFHTVIVKDAGGHILAHYPVTVNFLNAQSRSQDFFDLAKEHLIEDGIVSNSELSRLSYELV